jgi:biofilm PGA synthesis N-glycosyltransferase PgaC
MNALPIIYLTYMFVSFYLLTLTLLLYFKNRKNLLDVPKLTKFYSLSVIIPVFNEEKTIGQTIKAIYEVDYPKDKIEVIAVNDGSKDNTLNVLKELKQKYSSLKIINKPNSGKADSVNTALKFCKNDLVVVLDADSYPEKELFKKTVGYFDDSEVGAVTSTCTPRNRSTFLEKLQLMEYRVIAFTRKLLEYVDSIYVVPGTAGIYRREALLSIGGFDRNNITEDIEATWHLLKDGWKIRMCMNAHINTEVPSKIKPWFRQRRRWALGGLQCISKYKGYIFRKNMFGYFVVPFFIIGLFLGLIGLLIFLYLLFRRLLSTFLLVKFGIISSAPILTSNDFHFTPSVLNYFGIIVFLLFFFFNFFVLAIMKDNLFNKKEKQSFFNLVFYMTIYLLIYPLVLIISMWHFYRKKMVWR